METEIVVPSEIRTGINARTGSAARIPASHLCARPPVPRAVRMELTSRSHYRPAYAVQREPANPRGEMGWPLYTRLVGEMVDAGIEELGLSYLGEPFLCDWLPDAIEHAKGRGIRYAFLATDGCAATPEAVRRCMDAGLDSLKFAVNFADEAQFVALTKAKGRLFRDAIAHVKAARRVRDEGSFACGLYATSVRFEAVQPERMQRLVAEILPYVDEHYWLPHYATADRAAAAPEGAVRPVPCWALFTEAHVTYDGKLSACSFDAAEAGAMADLTRTPFLEAWGGERFARLRQAHLARDVRCTLCEDCVAHG